MDLQEAIQLLLDTGAKNAPLMELADTTAALVPSGYSVEDLTPLFDKYRETPRRKFADVSHDTADSFIEYWKLFNSEASRIFADPDAVSFTAILDYHGAGTDTPAGWRKHQSSFTLKQTPDWKTWLGSNRKTMTQLQFAEFIEDNISDIISPPAADMVEVSRHLEATKNAQFGSSSRTNNGQVQFKYQEEIKATVGSSQVEVPESFKLRLMAYQGTDPVEVTARLRYRIADGKLSMWYDLHRPHKIAEQAFNNALAQIKEGCGSVLIGRAA